MGEQHTLRRFDSELHAIVSLVAEMGGVAEKQVAGAIKSWTARDTTLAGTIATSDVETDSLQHEIETRVVAAIARHQPVADDLRGLIGALRISGDLERVGDLAKNVARRLIALKDDLPPGRWFAGSST